MQAEHYPEALEAFENSLHLQDDFDLAWYGKGLALSQNNQSEAALGAFEAAIAANPQGALAWFHKAEILCQLKRHDEARAAYEHVVQFAQPSHPLSHQAQKKLQELAVEPSSE